MSLQWAAVAAPLLLLLLSHAAISFASLQASYCSSLLRRAVGGTDLKIPDYDISGALKEVDELFAPIMAEAKELEAFSAKRVKEIEAEIAAVDEARVRRPLLLASCGRIFMPRPARQVSFAWVYSSSQYSRLRYVCLRRAR